MEEQINALVSQIRILEEQANNHTGEVRAEFFRRAGHLKNKVATLLNQQGRGQQQVEGSKIPNPSEYFGAKLPEGFEDNYFPGDYLTKQQAEYFGDNLTPEMKAYFSPGHIQHFDNAPSAPVAAPAPAPKQDAPFSDWATRKAILNALGIPC